MFVLTLVLSLLASAAFAEDGEQKFDVRINYLGGRSVNRSIFPIGVNDSSEKSWSATIHDQNGGSLDATFALRGRVAVGYRTAFSKAYADRNVYFGYEDNKPLPKPYHEIDTVQKQADTKYHEVFVLVPALQNFSVIVGAAYIGFNQMYLFQNQPGDWTTTINMRSVGPVLGLTGKRWFRGFKFDYSGRWYPRLSSTSVNYGSYHDEKGALVKWSNPTATASSRGLEFDGMVSYPLSRMVHVGLGYRYRPIQTPRQYENRDYHTGSHFTQSGMTLGLGFGF